LEKSAMPRRHQQKRDASFYREIELAVQKVFEENPSAAFLISDIAKLVFSRASNIERNHLIWIANAARKVAPQLGWTRGVAWQFEGKIVYFNKHDRRSCELYRRHFTDQSNE
jgi:hypothetical protein